jgi:UPF0755 protein
MKKIALFISTILIILAFIALWILMGPSVNATNEKYFYIHTGDKYEDVLANLKEKKILSNYFSFDLLASYTGYKKQVKPGKYEISKGMSLFKLNRMLKSGSQHDVRLVITKLRTKEDFAKKIGSNFEADSLEVIHFLLSNDSLAPFQLDTNTVMSVLIPNSYLFWWNGSFKKILERLKKQHDYFWEGKRTIKAKSLGLTPVEIYTIASIVEEETTKETDKGLIASVYINRFKKGMKLEACPTVKYAMRDFGLKRILQVHLDYPSPYNTYIKTGLPPGPICTPSINTIDAVLNAPKTDYLFFSAKSDFKGYSNFASNYEQHLLFARAYQKALDSLILRKKAKQIEKN